jgi:hypothetical protein
MAALAVLGALPSAARAAGEQRFTIEIRNNAQKDVELFTKGTPCENGGKLLIRAGGRHALACPVAAVKTDNGQYVHLELTAKVPVGGGGYYMGEVCVVQYARGTISAFSNPGNHCTINGINEFASLVTVHTTR